MPKIPLAARAALLAVLALPAAVRAQGPGPLSYVEAGASAETLTGPYADGRGGYVRATLVRPGATWRAEWALQERFGEAGAVFGAGHTRELGGQSFASAYVGSSAGTRFEPRLRAGVDVGHRWGARRALVTTAGAWVYDAPDEHRDLAAVAEAAYYAAGGVVVQAGARVTRSAPGPVWSPYAHAAVTHTGPGGRALSLRVAGGREGYLLVAPDPLEVGFASWEAQAAWRQPVGARLGVQTRAGHYRNPHYTRTSAEVGLYVRF